MKKLLVILSILVISDLHSQIGIKRMLLHDSTLNSNFIRRYNDFNIHLPSPLCCDEEYIYVGVLSDSIDVDRITLNPYVYFPLNINPINSTMILTYDDGHTDIFYQNGFPTDDNYVEYRLISNVYKSLLTKEVKSITFRGIGIFKLKEDNDKKFFVDFYKAL
jgi:hypothetical protein